jgi:mono/diheme cytochrome c family protein
LSNYGTNLAVFLLDLSFYANNRNTGIEVMNLPLIIKIVVLTTWVLLGVTYFMVNSASGSATRGNPVAVLSGPAEIYAAHCAKCHGADGRARTAKGKRAGATDFTGSDWNTVEARGIRIITNGKSEMPSFKRKLNANEIKSVFNYVLRFRR